MGVPGWGDLLDSKAITCGKKSNLAILTLKFAIEPAGSQCCKWHSAFLEN